MFKVLVIAYYFPPRGLTGVQRTLKFVKYMKNYNWEPTVITSQGIDSIVSDQSLMSELNEIKIIRVPHKTFFRRSVNDKRLRFIETIWRKFFYKIVQMFFIPDNKKRWVKKTYSKAEEVLKQENFDAVFITAPPFSIFNTFSKLKKKFNIPLVIDYRDLWHHNYFTFYPSPLHRLLNKKMEYKILKAADAIIVSNRKIKEKILNNYKFLTFNDILIITNGFDPEDIEKASVVPKHNDRMIIMYSGTFQIYNTPKYFFKAFKELSIEKPNIAKNIELHFIGFLGKGNKRLVKKLSIDEFVFDHGFVNHRDAISKLLSADVHLMTIWDKKNVEAFIPGKFYEYMGMKKPVITCVPEGAAKITAQEYAGSYICSPADIHEIKNTIAHVYEDYLSSKFPVIDESYLTNFRRDYLTEKLTKEFQFLVKADIQ